MIKFILRKFLTYPGNKYNNNCLFRFVLGNIAGGLIPAKRRGRDFSYFIKKFIILLQRKMSTIWQFILTSPVTIKEFLKILGKSVSLYASVQSERIQKKHKTCENGE